MCMDVHNTRKIRRWRVRSRAVPAGQQEEVNDSASAAWPMYTQPMTGVGQLMELFKMSYCIYCCMRAQVLWLASTDELHTDGLFCWIEVCMLRMRAHVHCVKSDAFSAQWCMKLKTATMAFHVSEDWPASPRDWRVRSSSLRKFRNLLQTAQTIPTTVTMLVSPYCTTILEAFHPLRLCCVGIFAVCTIGTLASVPAERREATAIACTVASEQIENQSASKIVYLLN